MADIGQAYVQIIPTAKGISSKISGAIEPTLGKSGTKAGKAFSSNFGSVATIALGNIAATAVTKVVDGAASLARAVVDVGKQAIDNYANMEQLAGGVEKLFGADVARTVRQNADQAFSTAQMSANDYMETVTSFSASLIHGLGGDTAEAARVADIAVRDMADNFNVFGTDMEMVQNAYSGFARNNFTMLDNLKLGYAGSQEEMLRLVNDSGIFQEKIEDISQVSFDDMVLAIHAIQEEMNITGTTANEAATTIQGSTESMKSAWSNLLTGLVDENADVGQLLDNFINTIITPDGKGGVLGTLIPRLGQLGKGIGAFLQEGLPKLAETLGPMVSSALSDFVQNKLPKMIAAGMHGLADAVREAPEVLNNIADGVDGVVESIVSYFAEHGDEIGQAGVDLFLALFENLPAILEGIGRIAEEIIESLAMSIYEHRDELGQTASDIGWAILEGIGASLDKIPGRVNEKWTELKRNTSAAFGLIRDMAAQKWADIKNAIDQKIEALKASIVNKLNSVKTAAGNAFRTVFNIITAPIQNAVNVISNLVNRIKGLFHFSVPTPHIPLPHFSISPSGWTVGNLLKGSIPHLSVNWYAQAAEEGALFTTPQIIGVGDAAQPELLLGERKLRELLNGGNTVNNYITVNGAEDPEAWAGKFAKQLKLEMRMA